MEKTAAKSLWRLLNKLIRSNLPILYTLKCRDFTHAS